MHAVRLPVLAALSLAMVASSVGAQTTLQWTGTLDNEWDSFEIPSVGLQTTNWGGTVPFGFFGLFPGSSDVASFGTASNIVRRDVWLVTDRTVRSINLAGSNTFRFLDNNNNQGTTTLILDTGDLTATGSGVHIFNVPVQVDGAAIWDIGGSASIRTPLGIKEGVQAVNFRKRGSGELWLNAGFDIRGELEIDDGTVVIPDGNGMVLADVAVRLDAFQDGLQLPSDATVQVAGLRGFGNLDLGPSGTFIIETDGQADRYGGRLSGSRTVQKRGLGSLALSSVDSTQTFFGTVLITEGELILESPSITATGSGVTVSGSGRLEGSGPLASLVIEQGGTVAPDDFGGSEGLIEVAGNLAVGPGGGTLAFKLGINGDGPDRIDVAGTADITGATLAATGSISSTNSPAPLTILTASTIVGGFANAADGERIARAFGGPPFIDFVLDMTSTHVDILPFYASDVDRDLSTGLDDFAIVVANLGNSGPMGDLNVPGDVTGDAVVDTMDVTRLSDDFGFVFQ